jgi:hypothetical protein
MHENREILRTDQQAPRKQRHTAHRIFERIRAERPEVAPPAESTVRHYVCRRGHELGVAERETFVPQTERTVTKAREGITAATAEQDDKTVYQGLGLLGLALLDLRQDDEAVRVLGEIERMVAARLRIVVGDETLFLERLFVQTKAEKTKNAIQEIARILWPVCREAAFADRLKTLANASVT